MLRSFALTLPVVLLATANALAQEGNYRGLYFTTPTGWTSTMLDGRQQLAPANVSASAAVVISLFGAENLSGRSLGEWFRAKLAADLTPRTRTLQEPQPQIGSAGELQFISGGRTVQEGSNPTQLQIYYGVSDGQQAALARASTASEAAMNRYVATVRAVFQGLHFANRPASRANTPPGGAATAARAGSAGASPAAPGSTAVIVVADVVGEWTHSTSSYADYVNSSTGALTGNTTIAYAQGFTFKPDSTYTHIFTGMINSRYVRETDAGTWTLQGGNLVTRSRERTSVKTYQVVAYRTAPDGTVFMTLLGKSYPRTEGNIALYGENYIRKPKPPP